MNYRNAKFLLTFAFMSLLASTQAKASELNIVDGPPSGTISNLYIFRAEYTTSNHAMLYGRYLGHRRDKLFCNGIQLAVDADQSIKMEVLLKGLDTLIFCEEDIAEGGVNHQNYYIEYGRDKGSSYYHAYGSLGLAYQGLRQQSPSRDYDFSKSQAAILGQVLGDYHFSDHWVIGGSLGYTLLAIPSGVDVSNGTIVGITSGDQDSMRFLDLDLHLGYEIPLTDDLWYLAINGGIAYSTSFVTGHLFGYRNSYGPELMPMIYRDFSPLDTIQVFAQYAQILSSSMARGSIFGIGVNEIHALKNLHSVIYSIEFTQLNVHSADDDLKLRSTVLSGKVGYSFF